MKPTYAALLVFQVIFAMAAPAAQPAAAVEAAKLVKDGVGFHILVQHCFLMLTLTPKTDNVALGPSADYCVYGC
jgi:hypothetical protein